MTSQHFRDVTFKYMLMGPIIYKKWGRGGGSGLTHVFSKMAAMA